MVISNLVPLAYNYKGESKLWIHPKHLFNVENVVKMFIQEIIVNILATATTLPIFPKLNFGGRGQLKTFKH